MKATQFEDISLLVLTLLFVAFPENLNFLVCTKNINPNVKILFSGWTTFRIPDVGLLTNQWATQINLVYKRQTSLRKFIFLQFSSCASWKFQSLHFFLPGRTWVRVARCHSWGRLCGQIAKVILHRGLFDIVLTNRPRHSVASATWCRTVGQRHFGPRKYKACHSDPKLRIPFGNCWVKPWYF